MMTHFVIKRERYQRMMMRGICENERPLAQTVGVSKIKAYSDRPLFHGKLANLKSTPNVDHRRTNSSSDTNLTGSWFKCGQTRVLAMLTIWCTCH